MLDDVVSVSAVDIKRADGYLSVAPQDLHSPSNARATRALVHSALV